MRKRSCVGVAILAIGLTLSGCSSATGGVAASVSTSVSTSAPAYSLPGSTCTVAPPPSPNAADLPAVQSPTAPDPSPEDLSKYVPASLPGFTETNASDYNLPYLLRNLTITPERDYPYVINAGFVGGYLAEMTANPNGGFINVMQARDHEGALALQTFYDRLDNPGAACASTFTVVGGPPGATGWQGDLITPRSHDTTVRFVVGNLFFSVEYLGPIDPDHTTLMQWVSAVAKTAGA